MTGKRAILLAVLVLIAGPRARGWQHLPVDGGAWRLALGDLDGDSRKEIVYGAYEGHAGAITADGKRLWRRELGGFPFAVAVNGRKVYAAAADGKLYAIGAGGAIEWTWRSRHGQALYAATPFRQGGKTWIATGGMDRTVTVLSAAGKPVTQWPVEQLVGRMGAADFDGDGADELFVVDRRNHGELLRFNGAKIERVWRRRMAVPDAMKNWENPDGNFNIFSLDLADVDGDGKPEIAAGDTYFNKQSVMLASAAGESKWIAKPLASAVSRDRWYELYSTAWVKAAEVEAASPGLEIVSVAGGLLRVFSARGEVLRQAEAPIGFADLVIDGRTLYLGSSPNGDRTIYKVPLEGDYASAFAGLQWQGRAREIADTIASIAERVKGRQPAATPGRVYDVQMGGGPRNEKQVEQWKRQGAWFRKRFPYPNLRMVASARLIESTPPLNPEGKPWNPRRWRTDSINGTMSVEQIVAAAALMERHGIPTIFNIGHSCMPFITLDTAEKVLRAAPRAVVGFLSAEDEDPLAFPAFAQHYLKPLSEMCLRHGGKLCITKNKGVWWMSMPSRPEVFDALLAPERRATMQGRTEDSNSRSPEINLMARLGLRQAGLIDSVQASIIGDLYSFNRFWQWEYPKLGHAWLRLLIAHTVLGANSFEYRSPGLVTGEGGVALPRIGEESIGLFLDLLGKGLVFAPAREQQAGLARVGIAVHPPPAKWVEDAHNGHRPEIWEYDAELENAVFPRNSNLWGMTPTPTHALQRVLFRKQRQFGYNVPPTPYGAVAIVPARADLKTVAGVDEWWHTDGIALWRDGGARLTGPAAAKALEASFEQAAARLPFRATGDDVFFHSVSLGEGRYRLYAVDPGWLDPAARAVSVRDQLPGRFRYRDMVSGESLPDGGGVLRLHVPAGAFRIVDAELIPGT